jgi:hypothetical protein
MRARERRSRKYLTNPDLVLVFNKEYIDISMFGKESIVRQSEAVNIQFDSTKAQWAKGHYNMDLLEDETNLFGIGIPTETIYNHVDTKVQTFPSIFTDYPDRTKVISYHLYAND